MAPDREVQVGAGLRRSLENWEVPALNIPGVAVARARVDPARIRRRLD